MKARSKGDYVVMAAVYSRNPDHLLLVRNLKEKDRVWKFIGETAWPGEFPIHTLIRGLWAEGGFCCNPFDSEITIEEVRPPQMKLGATPHIQYFFKTRMPYARLRDLSGKKFPGEDTDEYFETENFSLNQIDFLSNAEFFKPHRPLLNQFLGYPA